MNILTKKRLEQGRYLTVKELKDFIEKHNIPDNGIVMIQRVEDAYYTGQDISGMAGCSYTPDGIYPEGSKTSGWSVYLKEGGFYHDQLEFNKKMKLEIENRSKGVKPEYPKIEDPNNCIATEEELEGLKEQYTPAHSPVLYKDENNLFIDLHY